MSQETPPTPIAMLQRLTPTLSWHGSSECAEGTAVMSIDGREFAIGLDNFSAYEVLVQVQLDALTDKSEPKERGLSHCD